MATKADPPPRFLAHLKFCNSITRLPSDPIAANYVRTMPKGCIFSYVHPTPTPNPRCVAWSAQCGKQLDLDGIPEDFDAIIPYLAGNKLLTGMQPVAQAYGGRQFGLWVNQLGDGRTLQLGEILNACGHRWALQIKGSGKTPYSRFADGRCTLRSVIVEFLYSEAMHHLGVPTTRALCALAAPEVLVHRDHVEPAGLLLRIAPCFLRIGTFEMLAAQGAVSQIKVLADYVMEHFMPNLWHQRNSGSTNIYKAFLRRIIEDTAYLIAHWQSVGFVHGVMNTDNMSLLGLTLDFGPCAFMGAYDPNFTANETMDEGRHYSFAKQVEVAKVNLVHFALTLQSLMSMEDIGDAVGVFYPAYEAQLLDLFRAKLGLATQDPSDGELVAQLFAEMARARVDFTTFFRELSVVSREGLGISQSEIVAVVGNTWLQRYCARLQQEDVDEVQRRLMMNQTNPIYILRPHAVQEAVQAAEKGKYALVQTLLNMVENPFEERAEWQQFCHVSQKVGKL